MLQALLDTTEKQIYAFLSHCYEMNKKDYTMKELSGVFDWKTNKMQSIVQQVEVFRARYPQFTLTYDRLEKEVSIAFSPRFLLSQAYSVLLQGTVGFILLDALFQGDYHSLEQLSHKTFSSPRTIQRKLQELNHVLANYHLSYSLKKVILWQVLNMRSAIFIILPIGKFLMRRTHKSWHRSRRKSRLKRCLKPMLLI